jgi:hypothetical protein
VWVLTPEFLWTSHIWRFLCGVCKGDQFPKAPGTGEDLDRPIVGTCVHRSRVAQNYDHPKQLECNCGSVQASQNSEAWNES